MAKVHRRHSRLLMGDSYELTALVVGGQVAVVYVRVEYQSLGAGILISLAVLEQFIFSNDILFLHGNW